MTETSTCHPRRLLIDAGKGPYSADAGAFELSLRRSYNETKETPVDLKYSRHAKRRTRLYGISERAITDVLSTMNLADGKHEIVREVLGLRYPLKIVVSVQRDATTVVTVYPLKKGRKK